MREPLSIPSALPALIALLAFSTTPAFAEPAIGQIKSSAGAVSLLRGGESRNVAAGERVFQSDVLVTGPDGSVGITFADNSMLSLGPESRLSLDRFRFDTTTHEGAFESSLEQGTLAVKSGQIVKQTPEAMKVRTPGALLGVRGTEFVVRADGGGR
jgi:hypothetical protein